MNEKRVPLEKEEPKYKKKSKGSGLPRSKHKHIYETVLLTQYYHHNDLSNGAPLISEIITPTKVCVICGRIDKTDTDESYYVKDDTRKTFWLLGSAKLSKKALALPKWYAHDFWDKFAYKGEKD